MRKIVAGKLHGIHVTDANIDYHGSVTLDPEHCEQAGILPMEFVEIWNKNSGAHINLRHLRRAGFALLHPQRRSGADLPSWG